MKKELIYSMTDHTNLNKTATKKDIEKLCTEAKYYHAASVCVPPYYVSYAKSLLKDSDVKVCTVIGFPNGYSDYYIKELETTNALSHGADEIDMVININALKNGFLSVVENDILAVRKACDSPRFGGHIILKVIIETCLLTDEEIKTMCNVCINCGADYIKTSTGFDKEGATVHAVEVMKKEIGNRPLKIKAAGGIRDIETAEKMIKAGASRIGDSKVIPAIDN